MFHCDSAEYRLKSFGYTFQYLSNISINLLYMTILEDCAGSKITTFNRKWRLGWYFALDIIVWNGSIRENGQRDKYQRASFDLSYSVWERKGRGVANIHITMVHCIRDCANTHLAITSNVTKININTEHQDILLLCILIYEGRSTGIATKNGKIVLFICRAFFTIIVEKLSPKLKLITDFSGILP